MKILSLECSSLSAGAALIEDGKLIAESFLNTGLTHSQTLMPMVESMLKNTNTAVRDVDVISVSAGPGSFTGVRIGVAAAKGLADSFATPCFAVSSLEAIAYPFRDENAVVCAVMDARCNQVYTASFLKGERLFPDEAILIDELLEKLKGLDKPVVFAGDGAKMCFERLSGELSKVILADEQRRFPKASSVALIAYDKILSGEKTVGANELLPVYLRLPQAQRELNNKLKNKGE